MVDTMHEGVVVLGSHRSGSSALAGALVRAGSRAGSPSDLVGATAGNPRGHFERRDALLLHDRMLAELGGSWWSPPRGVGGPVPASVRQLIERRFRPLVRELRSAGREGVGWVLKDPRLSILLPLVAGELGAVVAVVLVREPRAVALSLARRDGIGLSAGLALWEVYTRAALRSARDVGPRIVVRHDALMKAPERELARILERARTGHHDAGPDIARAAATIDRSLTTVDADSVPGSWLTSDQAMLWDQVRSDDLEEVAEPGEQPWQALAEDGAMPAQLRRRQSSSGPTGEVRTAPPAQDDHLEQLLVDVRRDAAVMAEDLDRRLVRVALRLSRVAAPFFRVLRRRPFLRGLLADGWRTYRSLVPLRLRLLVPRRIRRRGEQLVGGVGALRLASIPTGGVAPADGGGMAPERLSGSERHLPAGVVGPISEVPTSPWVGPRVFAAYFPQFHVIPENERWWGEGYTDWRRVDAATPRFDGHEQPRRPGVLGRYDPTRPEVVRAQSRLAANAGVDGFMVYGYHFEGRLLLDEPLRRIADDACCDRDFFVCWANENWTRAWDGLDHDVLLRADNSVTGVLDAVSAFRPFIEAERYFRVDGRPILGIYAPQHVTDEAWRALGSELSSTGGGRLRLALIDGNGISRGRRPPPHLSRLLRSEDAFWVEFPPRHPAPQRLVGDEMPEGADPRHQYFSYSSLVGVTPDPAPVVVAPGVTPAWDNTARREEGASILVGSTPADYGRWLESAVVWARRKAPRPPFVLINGWNEWSEGAYLEPDTDEGFSRIHATRRAVVRAAIAEGPTRSPDPDDGAESAAVPAALIHAFFPHLLAEIVDSVEAPDRMSWWVTTAADSSAVETCVDILASRGLEFQVRPVVNRGRDIWPFALLLEEMLLAGVPAFMKLHTKRSSHRIDGDRWRRRLVGDVVHLWDRFSARLARDDGPALIIPAGHALPVGPHIGSNADLIGELLGGAGGRPWVAGSTVFSSGSMFIGRVAPFADALQPLALTAESFPSEQGQIDGTLAHALERAWVPLLAARGHPHAVA